MWITESNRLKHFIFAIPAAFVGTILFAAGLAIGMEFKDEQYGGKFDWLDVAATLLGGIIGQVVQSLLLYLIFIY